MVDTVSGAKHSHSRCRLHFTPVCYLYVVYLVARVVSLLDRRVNLLKYNVSYLSFNI